MATYLAGVGLALLLGLRAFAVTVSALLSTRAKNMRAIGLHYQYTTGAYGEEKHGPAAFVAFSLWVLVVAPLFSWLSVLLWAWSYASDLRERAKRPTKLKELHRLIDWRVLSRDELIEWQEEASHALGIPGRARTGEDEYEDPSYFVLVEHKGYFSDVRADPVQKTLTFGGHTPDHASVSQSVEEYRFDGDEVLTRVVEDHDDFYGRKDWRIKDGVVLESEIRKRYGESTVHFKNLDEELIECAALVGWHPIAHLTLRFWVMSQHPAEFPLKRRRHLVRRKLEEIEAAAREVTEEARMLGLEVHEGDDGPALRFPDTFTEADKQRAMDALSDKYFESVGIDRSVFESLNVVRADLRALVGESARAPATA